MNSVRYYIALMLVTLYPGALLYWFSVHPFIGLWRRVGMAGTLALHYAVIAALAVGIFRMRGVLLSVEFGTHWVLLAAGIALMAGSGLMRRSLSRHLKARILNGLPELAPDKYPVKLLTEGIYSRIRHPRYVQIVIAVAGYALLTNYLAVYVLAILSPVVFRLVVALEERELRARFGAEYEAYCAQVPRFIPDRTGRPL